VGLLAIAVRLLEKQGVLPADSINMGRHVEWLHASPLAGILAFALLAFSLFYFARKPLEPVATPPAPETPRTEI